MVVGPEAPLAEGMADVLREAGVAVLGPSKVAAQIEASKIHAKNLMRECGIPTADFAVCDDIAGVARWCRDRPPPYVVKADGLAAGKGVVICANEAEACVAAEDILSGKLGCGGRVLMEENLRGREVSFIALTDGKRALPLASCRDYKRIWNGDEGPNTGGMGAVSPAPRTRPGLSNDAMDDVIYPALRGMENAGSPFCGFLYAGLMECDDGKIRVLEFNCRLGDPEAQVILPRMAGDAYPAFLAAARGELQEDDLSWREEAAVCVVMASEGYPQSPRADDHIEIPEQDRSEVGGASGTDAMVFHAGTKLVDGVPYTSGGRVLACTALGGTVADACERAYAMVDRISFPGAQWRTDVAAGA